MTKRKKKKQPYVDLLQSQIALSVEEMKALEIFGMDTSDASMCWIKEPVQRCLWLVRHNEDCYEMGNLEPIPTYTLEDILLKIKGDLNFNKMIASSEENDSPWAFIILQSDYSGLHEPITINGKTPLEAAFYALVEMLKKVPESILELKNNN